MGSNSGTRRFEYRDEKSSKFWEISVAGNSFTVRYGKIGTDGQSQPKEFADAATAEKQAQKLIAEKIGKGYQEVVAETKPSTPEPAAQPSEATKAENPPKASKPPKIQPVKPLKPEEIAKDPESTADALEALAGSSEAIDRLLAKHPKAGAVLLEILSHSSDKATRKSVCLNPDTPKETLVRLAPQFPGDFFQNPAFDWLLLEDPNLLFDIGGGVLKNILKRPECPEIFLKWAVKHGDEGQQLAAAMNPHTPVRSLRELLKSAHSTVVAAAKGHTALAGEQPPEAMDPEQAFLAGIAEALANLSPEEATDLLEKGYLGKHQVPALASKVQLRILGYFEILRDALNFEYPPEILGAILEKIAINEDDDPIDLRTRCAALMHRACPPTVLDELANSPKRLVRMAIARNPACPLTLLELLANDADEFVRACVAQNPIYPLSKREILLVGLSKSKEPRVRELAAKNPVCPESVLTALVKDKDADVRLFVASNPNSPATLYESLKNDKHYLVRRASGVRLNSTEDLKDAAKDNNPAIRAFAASESICPESILEHLAKDRSVEVRRLVGRHPNCPTEILAVLANDSDYEVRVSVAKSPNCPVSLLETLAKDPVTWVKKAVAENVNCSSSILEYFALDGRLEMHSVRQAIASLPSCPSHLLEILSKDNLSAFSVAKNQATPITLLAALARDGNTHFGLAVAGNKSCSSELRLQLIEGLQKDKSSEIRLGVARIPACPESILVALSEDKDKDVRHVALARVSSLLQELVAGNEGVTRWMHKETSLMPWATPCREDAAETRLLHPTKALTSKGVNHHGSLIRALAFSQPDVPVETLVKNQKHLSWLVRGAIARNRNCPAVVLKVLEKDSHQAVAGLARRNRATAADSRVVSAARIDESIGSQPDVRGLLDAIAQSLTKLKAPTSGMHPALKLWLPAEGKSTLLGSVYSKRADVASNPNCPPSLLEELAKDEDRRVRCKVLLNANCSLSLIEELAKDRDDKVREAVASSPNCTPSLLEVFAKAKDSDVRCAVARNPNCPGSLLEALARDKDVNVRRHLAFNPGCPVSVLEILAKDSDWVRSGVASNANCPLKLRESLLKAFAKNKDVSVRHEVASNPYSPSSLLEALGKDKDSSVVEAVASNPNCLLSFLETFSQSKDFAVRCQIARNPACPVAFLENLANDESRLVRLSVPMNRNTPVALLKVLAEDSDDNVRGNVASAPNCPVSLLEVLAKDKSDYVRSRVVTNPNCPVSLLDILAKDESDYVRSSMVSNPDCPVSLLHEMIEKTQHQILAMNMSPSPLVLADCIYPECPPKLKLLAALQLDCPKEQLFKAANSADPLERLAAALNPSLQTAQVMRLLDDPDVNVRYAAARHPHCISARGAQ